MTRQPLKLGLSFYLDGDYKWRWRIVSGNYRIILAITQGYVRKTTARHNALLVKAGFA